MTGTKREGLEFVRLMMVIGSLSPLFILWAVRGLGGVPDQLLWPICALLLIIPNGILLLRIRLAGTRKDEKLLTVQDSDDQRDHLLVYLFAVLIPLYDANVGSSRDALATIVAFLLIVFLFFHLKLHYLTQITH